MIDAFLKDIIAHPDDDTPRLVLADYLEDIGDPIHVACGQFIRAQVRLAHLPLDHPDRAAFEASELLNERRASVRLAEGIRGHVQRWRCHRGLVEEVTLREARLLALGGSLFALAPIRRLNLTLSAARYPDVASLWRGVCPASL
jgi:uncharacterized protein (TIGR02996 family)